MFHSKKTSLAVFLLTVSLLLITVTGCTNGTDGTQDQVSKTVSQTTHTSSEYRETLSETIPPEDTSEDITENSTVSDKSEYEQLREKLDTILAEKSFHEEVDLLFYDTLDRLYENYPTWADMYRDMPNRKDYIEENFIAAAEVIHDVTFYDKKSDEAQTLLDEGEATAWMSADEEGRPYIVIMATPSTAADRETRDQDIEFFYHEMTHCRTNRIIFDSDPDDLDDEYYVVAQNIIEGCATFHMKFIYPMFLDNGGAWCVANEDQSIEIEYIKSNCLGYLLYLNEYEKLMYLSGYETIYKMEMGEIPLDEVKVNITARYGNDTGNEFFYKLTQRTLEYEESFYGDEVYELSVQFEDLFLSLMKYDIENSENLEQFRENERLYLKYKEKNLPVATDGNFNILTEDVFDIRSVDTALENKKASFN